MIIKPVLLFGYGNPSRGDDALGPQLLNYLESHCNLEHIEILSDFQLQIEHALDLENRSLVLFIDASVTGIHAYDFVRLQANKDVSYSTHAMSPSAVLDVYQTITKQAPPPCFLLTIKAERLELGEGLSPQAQENLAQAGLFALHLLQQATFEFWLTALNKFQPDSIENTISINPSKPLSYADKLLIPS